MRKTLLAAVLAALLACAVAWAAGQSMGGHQSEAHPSKLKTGVPRTNLICELLPQNYRYVAGGTDVWWDSTGNGYNFTQATAANKPVYLPGPNSVSFRPTDTLTGPELPLSTTHTTVFKIAAWRSKTSPNAWTLAQLNNVGGASGTVTIFLNAPSGSFTTFYFPNAGQTAWTTYNDNGIESWPKTAAVNYEEEGEPFFLASVYDESATPKLVVYKFANKVKTWNPAVSYSTASFTTLPHYDTIVGASRLGSNATGYADLMGMWVFNTALATATILDAINW